MYNLNYRELIIVFIFPKERKELKTQVVVSGSSKSLVNK